MMDALGREIDYLRLSVTDRCNLRCIYCMPPSGVELVSHDLILTVEETVRLAGIIKSALGLRKIRITGGEPLVRKGVLDIIRGVRATGIDELVLTTNGVLLGDMAMDIAAAGIQRVNVSLDSLRDRRLKRISRGAISLSTVEMGIRKAQEAGMMPVKVNCVVLRDYNDDEITDFLLWGKGLGLMVRFIEHMPYMLPDDCFVSRDEILEKASELGALEHEAGSGETAGIYRIPERNIRFGVVAPHSDDMCASCRRVRLSASGNLFTCLSSSEGTPLRDMLRGGADEGTVSETVRSAVLGKPESHGGCFRTEMWKVGG
jgi:cyclic pyranopterin phosphate synthase